MEYVEGETLKDVIRREAPMDPGRTIAIVKEILAATRFAHKRGVIHRDLKPQNVIIEPDDHIKVADFGIAARRRVATSPRSARSWEPPSTSRPSRRTASR